MSDSHKKRGESGYYVVGSDEHIAGSALAPEIDLRFQTQSHGS